MDTNKYGDIQTVDAVYITEEGGIFDHQSPWPHENFVTLRWKHPEEDDDTTIEFVYFGAHKNRLIYHAVRIEENSSYLCWQIS